MIRGVRGATTIERNEEYEIIETTEYLLREMISSNAIIPENISYVIFTATDDVTEAFPARALRNIEGFKYVPVMCMKELSVTDGLEKCIRVLMMLQTDKNQDEIKHIYLNNATILRPDLMNE